MRTELRLFGRAWDVRRSKEEGRGVHERLFVTDPDSEATVTAEYHIPSRTCSLSLHAESAGDDAAFSIGICLPPVALYLSADSRLFRRLSKQLIAMVPDAAASKWGGRSFSIAIHDSALWWHIGVDRDCWSSKRPKWRDSCWYPLGFFMRRGEPEVIEQRDVIVPMLERSYRGSATLERSRWGFQKLPSWLDRVLTHAQIEMHKGEQIPFPGKGESDWDCGENATFSMHCPARTIEEGVGTIVASVLRRRHDHGGDGWRPAAVGRAEAS
jgi:hypothetical protein